MILHGNCIDLLKTLEPNSIDSIVTDPPYGLSFMGKKWDYDVPSIEIWLECLRVLKPGGHLLSFGGTRTYHRLVVNIEDAGFEIRDCIQWLYGSGFPKSHDISKGIDKQAGAEREIIGPRARVDGRIPANEKSINPYGGNALLSSITTHQGNVDTLPATPEAIQWQGWGTALKPANEPICVARKPLEKGLTVAANVLKWGTGAINIDASRIGLNGEKVSGGAKMASSGKTVGNFADYEEGPHKINTQGRWPANILLDEEAAAALDEQSGITTRKDLRTEGKSKGFGATDTCYGSSVEGFESAQRPIDLGGGASRFFYVAKSSKRDRNSNGIVNNIHPTCKPTKLMQYLITLVTPPNGTVLDPFMGSGSTGVAAKNLGFEFVGCEMNEEYFEISKSRYKKSLDL